MSGQEGPVSEIASALAGYLNGSPHRGARRAPAEIASWHRQLEPDDDVTLEPLGEKQWAPVRDEATLRLALVDALDVDGVAELVLFGSQARGSITGYSDVDALLVIEDAIAESPAQLEALRPRVLAAQRSVLAYQPMQHHGFLVATRRMLTRASQAVGMPAQAFATTRALVGGRRVEAAFGPNVAGPTQFLSLARALLKKTAWPRNARGLHGVTAMFELLPTLYLQSTGRSVAKHESFALAREEFQEAWWPYDVLRDVRLVWPRERRWSTEIASRLPGGPWPVLRVASRLPSRRPAWPAEMLTDDSLAALRGIAAEMVRRAS